MKKYQITFKWGGSCRSYQYFDAEKENAHKVAAEVANLFVDKDKDAFRLSFQAPQKYPRTIDVFEYDNDLKKPVKKIIAHRFKLRLLSVTVTYNTGRKEKTEYYEAVD